MRSRYIELLRWKGWKLVGKIADHGIRLLLAGIFIWFWWHLRATQGHMEQDMARYGALTSVQPRDYLAVTVLRNTWLLIPLLYIGTQFSWKQILVMMVWGVVLAAFLFEQYRAQVHYTQASQREIVFKQPDSKQPI